MPPPPPAAPPAHAPAAGALPAAMGEPPPAPLALPPQWAGLPYVHKRGRIDLEATRLRLTAMMLRLGFGEDQVAGLDCDALWTRITGHHNRDALVMGGKKWEKIINPPLSGRATKRTVLVAWDLGATPPMWTSVDPTRRVKRAQQKLEQAEQRKKRRVDATASAASAASAAPEATRPVGLSDEERDAFDVAFPEGVWPERARHMLPFLVKTTRIAHDKERDTGHKARALCPALCPVSAAPRTLRRSVRAGARAWAPSCPSLLLLWVPGLEYWPLPLLTPHILGGVLGTGC